MKDYNFKNYADKIPPEATPAAPAPRPQTKSTVDAMLDKISELIRTRDAWATLAQLLLLRGDYPKDDPELAAALHACSPRSNSATPDSL
jgi:hypothetical protein